MKVLITAVALFLASMAGATDFNTGETTAIATKPDPQAEASKPELFQAIATGYSIELNGSNFIPVIGPIGSSTASEFISKLHEIDSREVIVYLDSPGGSVIAGNSMITALKDSGKKSVCVAKFAASMAFGILQACDERYLTRDGVIMQHEMSYSVQGSAPHNRSLVNLLERIGYQMDLFQSERLGLSYSDFKYKTIRDYWLFSQDAVTDKAADGLATVTCSNRLLKKKVRRTLKFFIFKVEVEMSACPLITEMKPVKKGKNAQTLPSLESFKTPTMIKKINTLK